ncbi:MAG: SAF domain-containing protein [Firmicutes bacterium]|nr:SAF domain-containing protein [Bacillota bacterium]
MTIPPARHTVLVLKAPVSAGEPVSPADVTTLTTLSAWPGALTTVPTGQVARQALPADTPLLAADWTPAAAFHGLKPGEALWTVAVTPTSGALVQLGQRVEVWSTGPAGPRLWALGVRVVGLYSSSGTPLTTPGSSSLVGGGSSSAAGLVALAVPANDLPEFLALTNPLLVTATDQPHFTLVAPVSATATHSAGAGPASPAPTTARRPRG